MVTPQELLLGIPLGTRVVARYLLADGRATDALGLLVERDAASVVIETRRGPDRVVLAAVIAAKTVPPPPARRVTGDARA
jgi:hypothetical protein